MFRINCSKIFRELTFIVHIEDNEAISERRDVQHVEERGFAEPDLVSFLQQLDVTLRE